MIVVDELQLFRKGEKTERDYPTTSQIHVSKHTILDSNRPLLITTIGTNF